jgi:lipopolysaccharide heptosyltransferase II
MNMELPSTFSPRMLLPDPRWARARNVLCVRLDNLGDVIMTTPALRALKTLPSHPRLTLLASSLGAAAVPYLPEVDDAIVYDAPWVKCGGTTAADADLQFIDALRERRFDAAVIFTVYSQNPLPAALYCRLAGIPLCLAHCRENPYQLLSDWVAESEPQHRQRHEVQRQLDLVGHIGAYAARAKLSFRVRPDDRRRVRERLGDLGVDAQRPWLLIHPGATAASRRYPAEYFALAARDLQRQLQLPVVFGGTAAEAALVAKIRELMRAPSHSLAGSLSLGECAAAIDMAALLIANNSGAVHIAAACDTPVVDLYALTNPQHTPWQVANRTLWHDVTCKYCYRSVCREGHHGCLRGVAPESVVRSAVELLSEAGICAQPLPEAVLAGAAS